MLSTAKIVLTFEYLACTLYIDTGVKGLTLSGSSIANPSAQVYILSTLPMGFFFPLIFVLCNLLRYKPLHGIV